MEKERWNDIKQGNIAVYSETYVIYYKKLYNYGKKLTDNTALIEDAIQAIFIKLWKDRQKLSSVYAPNSYIFYSFRNYILKEKQRLQKKGLLVQEEEFAVDHFILCKEATLVLNKRLQHALEKLTSRQREAIFLRFYEGLSYEEVAQIMNISVKGTYKLIARSLLNLKNQLCAITFFLNTYSLYLYCSY